jgi:YD repeat-containing protein
MAAKCSSWFLVVLAVGFCVLPSCRKPTRVAAEFQFDAAGRLISSIGPDGKKTTYKYDDRGLPTDVASPDGSAHFGYDAHGNPMFAEAFQRFDQVKTHPAFVYWEVGDNTIEIEDQDLWGAGVLMSEP